MNTLFDVQPLLPQGWNYYQNFITPDEGADLVKNIGMYNLQTMKFHQYEAKRKVISFGHGWSFTEKKLRSGPPLPKDFDFLVHRVTTLLAIPKESIAQFLITEYPVGSVINWHRDAPPYHIVAGISLLTNCTFKLRPHDQDKRSKWNTLSLNVERRSLYTMQGAAKTEWQHSTAPVKEVRYSITLRTLRE